MPDAGAQLEAGRAAVEAGDWAAARDAFAAALGAEETADALLGLGDAQWWLEDVEASLRHRERTYALLRPVDAMRAAMVGMGLCINYGASPGNIAAARGWLGRVARLVDEAALEPMAGWVLLGRAALANDSGDPAAAHELAGRAHEHAQRFRGADLELCALSQMAGSLVKLGRVAEGIALLDEAMAGALGGEGRPDTVVHASCVTIVACSMAAELKRAAQWIRAAEAFNRRYGSSHLYAVCRTHHGGVLFAVGRWEEAERELRAARSRPPRRQRGGSPRLRRGARPTSWRRGPSARWGPPMRRAASPTSRSRTWSVPSPRSPVSRCRWRAAAPGCRSPARSRRPRRRPRSPRHAPHCRCSRRSAPGPTRTRPRGCCARSA